MNSKEGCGTSFGKINDLFLRYVIYKLFHRLFFFSMTPPIETIWSREQNVTFSKVPIFNGEKIEMWVC